MKKNVIKPFVFLIDPLFTKGFFVSAALALLLAGVTVIGVIKQPS